MSHPLHATNRAKIIALKRSLNPATGKPFTYEEIGQTFEPKLTRQAIEYYVPEMPGCCPGCLRKMRPLKTAK